MYLIKELLLAACQWIHTDFPENKGINPHLPFGDGKQTETSCIIQISDLAFTQPFVQVNIITEQKRGTKEQILILFLNGQNNQQAAGDGWVSIVAIMSTKPLTRHKP